MKTSLVFIVKLWGRITSSIYPMLHRVEKSRLLRIVGKVSELSTHSVILNNVEKIPIKRNKELTFSELYPGSLSQ